MNIQNDIISIIKQVLKNEDLVLEPQFSAEDVEGWDSLHHVMIIAETEKRFNVKFDFLEVMNIKTIEDLAKTVEDKL